MLTQFLDTVATRLARFRTPRQPTNEPSWKDIEYFDPSWESRIVEMCQLMRDEKSILDLGCGEQLLRRHLPQDSLYLPVDYKKRTPDVIVCDFNLRQFPKVSAELAFVSGCLEYVEDVPWFLGEIGIACQVAVVSYCSLEKHPSLQARKALAWVNALTRGELIGLFASAGMRFVDEVPSPNHELLRFQK